MKLFERILVALLVLTALSLPACSQLEGVGGVSAVTTSGDGY